MLSEHYRGMLQNKSVIREMCAWGTARAAQIGKENVFDYSLGNPRFWGSAKRCCCPARRAQWPTRCAP